MGRGGWQLSLSVFFLLYSFLSFFLFWASFSHHHAQKANKNSTESNQLFYHNMFFGLKRKKSEKQIKPFRNFYITICD